MNEECTINGTIAFANVKRECIGNEKCALERRSFSFKSLFCVALQKLEGFYKDCNYVLLYNIM